MATDYEQKYKEALERAREFQKSKDGLCVLTAESIFPELAGSEDERIRKELVEAFEALDIDSSWNGISVKSILAYLEKQKEQKPAEWSEEDEKDMAHIIRILDDCYVYGTHDLSKTDHENLVNKLKSLRPSWKPSEEQMNALKVTLDYMPDTFKPRCTLMTLQDDLKKQM